MFSSVLKSGQLSVRAAGTVIAAAAAITLALVLAFTGTAAANPVAQGATALKLNPGVAKVLSKNGVRVAPVGPAKVRNGAIAFPITSGRLDPTNAVGGLRHSGGLRFQAGGKSLVVQSFTVRTDRGGALANSLVAKVGSSSVRLLTLDLGRAQVNRRGLGVLVSGVRVKLTAGAASALNRTFNVRLFKRGLTLGTVAVAAQPKTVGLEATSSTDLTLDPAAADALTGLGVAVAPIGPASALPSGEIAFPIDGGRVDASTFAGQIRHTGGISLTKDATVVNLTNFTINVDGDPDLTAVLNGGDRVSILDLDLSGLTVDVTGRNVTLGNASAGLTAAAAGALSAAFGAEIPAGLVLGNATVRAVVR